MSKTPNVWLILPDVHFPQHDPLAVEVACKIRAHYAPRLLGVLQLGDLADADVFSSHAPLALRTPETFFEGEIGPANAFLDRLQGRAQTPLVVLMGNHEQRVERSLARGPLWAPSLRDALDFEHLWGDRVDAKGKSRRPRKNFTLVRYAGRGFHHHYRIRPNLIAIHGWSCAKRAADVHLDQVCSRSVVFGHVHRRVEATKTDPLTGEIYHAWSPGCLSQLIPDYQANHPSNHVHGVSVVFCSRHDPLDWTRYTVEIRDGRAVLPCGKEIRA